MTFWMSERVADDHFYPMLADFNQDGQTELYIGNEIFIFDFSNPSTPALRRVLSGNLSDGFSWGGNNVVAADLLTPADCNGGILIAMA